MAQFFEVHPDNPQPRLLKQAAAMLKDGGILAVPTDSSYAFVCALDNKQVVDRLRRIRQIDEKRMLTLLCSDLSQLASYAMVDNHQFRILKLGTPGPYTFILDATKEVPRRISHPSRKTIGLRVPDRKGLQLLLEHREPAPELSFTGPDGQPITLSRFAGRVVVLNLWATWCAPCVREMPALDRLAVLRPELAVVAVSLDAKGPAVAEQFMRQHRLTNLPVYHEGKGEALRLAGARGLPVSFVLDREGRVATIVEGAIDWTSPYMLELLSKV